MPQETIETEESYRDILRASGGKYLRWMGAVAGISFLGINLAANAEVSGEPIYHAYFQKRTDQEKYLSQRLSSLGRSVTVNCLSLYDMHGNTRDNNIVAEGYVVSVGLFAVKDKMPQYMLPIITMSREDCQNAAVALRDASRGEYATTMFARVDPKGKIIHPYADSLGKLTHEYEHIDANSRSEPLTECHNTQHFESRLEKLGYPPNVAIETSHFYAMSTYRLASYLSPECRPGGKMDLHINGDFPVLPWQLRAATNEQ